MRTVWRSSAPGRRLDANVNNGTPTVRLELDSRPECLTLVRSALIGIGETLAFDPELLDDVKTAVSEACANVVLHAYDGAVGPLAVVVAVGHDRVEAAVHDGGSGIRAVSSAEDRMGVGLAVITALSERAEFISRPGEGTEVRMAFAGAVRQAPCTAELSGPVSIDGNEPPAGMGGRVVVSVSTPELLEAVLGRVARGMAASAHFSVQRLGDLRQVSAALAEHARAAAIDGGLTFTLEAARRRLEVTVGPFPPGSSTRLGPELASLSDELSVDGAGESETLRVVVSDSRSR
jgi:serine/threonine-protein kinase RsbW